MRYIGKTSANDGDGPCNAATVIRELPQRETRKAGPAKRSESEFGGGVHFNVAVETWVNVVKPPERFAAS